MSKEHHVFAAQSSRVDAQERTVTCAPPHLTPVSYQDVFDLWAGASIRRDTTVSDYRKVFASFAGFVHGKELALITRKDVLNFRDFLTSRGQSPTTVTRKVGILKTLFRVALDYEQLVTNPADQVKTVRGPQQKARIAFSPDDLSMIFRSSIYTDNYRPVGGGREACFWLPLLALFTGARLEELAQLLVEDIHHREGMGWYLNITDDAAHSKLKNAASRRRIPLHSTLQDCGFLDYVESMRERKFLFPDLKPNPRQKLGGYFSTFFSGYLRTRVRITDKRKVFHSFRHTFKDICRNVGIDEAVHDALTGHTTQNVGRRYGNEHYPLAPLFEAMERFDVKGLDLSQLYTRPPIHSSSRAQSTMVSAYYGVIVAICHTPGGTRVPPYVLARCQGAEAAISIGDSRVISGSLPFGKQVLVQAWIEIHREELAANWENGKTCGDFFRIDPLR